MKLLLTSLLAVSLLIALVPDSVARPTSLRLAYQGGTPLGAGALEDECSGEMPFALGVVCLAVPAGSKAATFVVDDASRLSVGGSYYTYDAAGEPIGAGGHCGAGTAPVVAGGFLVVRLELINGPLFCASEGVTSGEPTRGYVTFTLK